jgi:hypothetical protein
MPPKCSCIGLRRDRILTKSWTQIEALSRWKEILRSASTFDSDGDVSPGADPITEYPTYLADLRDAVSDMGFTLQVSEFLTRTNLSRCPNR